MGIFTFPLAVLLILQDLNVPRIVEPLLFGPSRCSHWDNACTWARLSRAYGVSVLLRSTLVVWGALEAMKHRWYLLSPCVYVPLLLYQKEGEKKAPFFPFSPFLFVR
jgi:hypothetical protein